MSIRDIAEPVSLNDGTAMPGYGFGCYAAHGEEIINAIRWAVRDGYRYIDSAAMYGNEAEVGEAIRTCGVQREDLSSPRKSGRPVLTIRMLPLRNHCGIWE